MHPSRAVQRGISVPYMDTSVPWWCGRDPAAAQRRKRAGLFPHLFFLPVPNKVPGTYGRPTFSKVPPPRSSVLVGRRPLRRSAPLERRAGATGEQQFGPSMPRTTRAMEAPWLDREVQSEGLLLVLGTLIYAVPARCVLGGWGSEFFVRLAACSAFQSKRLLELLVPEPVVRILTRQAMTPQGVKSAPLRHLSGIVTQGCRELLYAAAFEVGPYIPLFLVLGAAQGIYVALLILCVGRVILLAAAQASLSTLIGQDAAGATDRAEVAHGIFRKRMESLQRGGASHRDAAVAGAIHLDAQGSMLLNPGTDVMGQLVAALSRGFANFGLLVGLLPFTVKNMTRPMRAPLYVDLSIDTGTTDIFKAARMGRVLLSDVRVLDTANFAYLAVLGIAIYVVLVVKLFLLAKFSFLLREVLHTGEWILDDGCNGTEGAKAFSTTTIYGAGDRVQHRGRAYVATGTTRSFPGPTFGKAVREHLRREDGTSVDESGLLRALEWLQLGTLACAAAGTLLAPREWHLYALLACAAVMAHQVRLRL